MFSQSKVTQAKKQNVVVMDTNYQRKDLATMTSILDQLKKDLEFAKVKADIAYSELCQTPQYAALSDARKRVVELQDKIKKESKQLQEESFEKSKSEILQAGFEVRSGHLVDTTSKHIDAEAWKYLIVASSRPAISSVLVLFVDNEQRIVANLYDDRNSGAVPISDWILGHGESRDRAWEDAICSWFYDRGAEALKGLDCDE